MCLLLLLLPQAAWAVQPNEMLPDPRLEARARHISEGLRCLVCQNQSIDDSDADLAHDLRVLVRQRLQAGDSDAQVRQYLVDRYGDYILLNPPFKSATLALWLGAPFLLVAGSVAVFAFYRRGKRGKVVPRGEDVAIPRVKPASFRSKLVLGLAIFVFAPLGSGLTYLYLGSPELPARPYAGRLGDPEFILATKAEKLAAQLEAKPDVEGFKKLADIYFALRRYDLSAVAYQQVIDLKGENAAIWSELGEAIALSQGNRVVPEARQAFVKSLRLDPHQARAEFYLGLFEMQNNDPRRAVAVWRDLEQASPPDAPWRSMLEKQIAETGRDAGFDPASIPPVPPSLDLPDAAAIMAMKPDEQQAMIRQMVEHLAAKMKDNPRDIDGWLRLAKAYRVLGEDDKAVEAEGKAAVLKGSKQ